MSLIHTAVRPEGTGVHTGVHTGVVRLADRAEKRRTMRVNVSVPDALMERVRSDLPDLNVSAVLQQALRSLLDCEHERTVCADCGDPVDVVDIARESMGLLWAELVHAWQPLVDRGGTAVGAARVGKEVAVRLGAAGAEWRALPRPPRHRQAS